MKQIPFSLDCFGPDGLLKDGYEWRLKQDGTKVLFAKLNSRRDQIGVVFEDGVACTYNVCHVPNVLQLYRRARTPEEIAKEFYVAPAHTLFERFVKAVQAGMDEMN